MAWHPKNHSRKLYNVVYKFVDETKTPQLKTKILAKKLYIKKNGDLPIKHNNNYY